MRLKRQDSRENTIVNINEKSISVRHMLFLPFPTLHLFTLGDIELLKTVYISPNIEDLRNLAKILVRLSLQLSHKI